MSIILKGIDIPQKLYTDIRIYKDGTFKKIIGENTIISFNENVQAIQIPKDHGRLIDSEEILTPIYCIPKTIGLTDKAQMHLTDMIENAPAILESEGINEYHIERD